MCGESIKNHICMRVTDSSENSRFELSKHQSIFFLSIGAIFTMTKKKTVPVNLYVQVLALIKKGF